MTRPLTRAELCRGTDMAVIHAAFDAHMPNAVEARPSLMDVAELCRLHAAARWAHDPLTMRDRLITIASEWDLDRDVLSEQSDACIHELAELLRRNSPAMLAA